MESTVLAISQYKMTYQASYFTPRASSNNAQETQLLDTLDFGSGGALNNDQSMQIVLEVSIAKLQAVVTDARAALGLPEDAVVDTSPEATANRIADFALGAFSVWSKNHADLADDEARKQFADFIGAAIQQGISEARGILGALNALNPEIDQNINSTWEIIQARLNDFVAGNQQ